MFLLTSYQFLRGENEYLPRNLVAICRTLLVAVLGDMTAIESHQKPMTMQPNSTSFLPPVITSHLDET